MKNWKIYHNTVLLSAFAFKILVIGVMLTLATHNICLQKLVDEDFNIVKLANKKGKRKDEHYHQFTIETKQAPAINSSIRVVLEAPFRYIVNQLLTPFRLKQFLSSCFPRQYIPGKIFIRHCSLVR